MSIDLEKIMFVIQSLTKYSHCEWEEIWHLDRRSKESKIEVKVPYKNWSDSPSYNSLYVNLISNIQLSENGRYLSLNICRIGNPSLQSALL